MGIHACAGGKAIMARSVSEWQGRNDDAMPPPRVRQRILERENKTCYICGGVIQDGQGFELDHKEELKDGGANVESNLFPTHPKCHRRKTAEKAVERAPIERKKQKHTGAKKPKGEIKSRGFEKKERKSKPQLPPRRLYG